jgi:hypothetical protein
MAMEKRHEMTGSEFQAWLDERETECDKMVVAEEHFIGWQLGYEGKERREALQKKTGAHLARTSQIYEYCEVGSSSIHLITESRSSNRS